MEWANFLERGSRESGHCQPDARQQGEGSWRRVRPPRARPRPGAVASRGRRANALVPQAGWGDACWGAAHAGESLGRALDRPVAAGALLGPRLEPCWGRGWSLVGAASTAGAQRQGGAGTHHPPGAARPPTSWTADGGREAGGVPLEPRAGPIGRPGNGRGESGVSLGGRLRWRPGGKAAGRRERGVGGGVTRRPIS